MPVQPPAPPASATAARVGVVVFDASDEVNAAMAQAVTLLRGRGVRAGGLLQHFGQRLPNGKNSMWLTDIASGQVTRLDQPRGAGARACTLDASALAEGACRLRGAVASGCDVIVVPRFGSAEAEGRGLRLEIAEAILSGAAVIIGARASLLPDLACFLGAPGTVLPAVPEAIAAWALNAAGIGVAEAAD